MKWVPMACIFLGLFIHQAQAQNANTGQLDELTQRVEALEDRLEQLGARSMPFVFVGETEMIDEVAFAIQGCEIKSTEVACYIGIKNEGFGTNVILTDAQLTDSTGKIHRKNGRHEITGAERSSYLFSETEYAMARDEQTKYAARFEDVPPGRTYSMRVDVSVGDKNETLFIRGIVGN